MKDMTYESAMANLENGQYKKAFETFKVLAEMIATPKEIRADCFNMMGAIINAFDPYIDADSDESGLTYFRKAIDLQPNHVGALLNIVENFDPKRSFPSLHNDSDAFQLAARRLLTELATKLTNADIDRVKLRVEQYTKNI